MFLQEQTLTKSNFELIVELLGIIIWPATLLILLFMFRRHLSNALKNIDSLKAGSDGISMTFAKKIEDAKKLIKDLPERTTTDSSNDIMFNETDDRDPYEQLIAIKGHLYEKLKTVAVANNVSPEANSYELCEILKRKGVFSKPDAQLVDAIIDIVISADKSVTKHQINDIKSLYRRIDI